MINAKTDEQQLRQNIESAKRSSGIKMFTIIEYVGVHANSPDWTLERSSNALMLIMACTKLQRLMEPDGVSFNINPKTKTIISGEIYGGFRPQDCPIGAPHSIHKDGGAADLFDPLRKISIWALRNQYALESCGLYMEHPDSTPTWCHLQIVPPKSGHRVFYP